MKLLGEKVKEVKKINWEMRSNWVEFILLYSLEKRSFVTIKNSLIISNLQVLNFDMKKEVEKLFSSILQELRNFYQEKLHQLKEFEDECKNFLKKQENFYRENYFPTEESLEVALDDLNKTFNKIWEKWISHKRNLKTPDNFSNLLISLRKEELNDHIKNKLDGYLEDIKETNSCHQVDSERYKDGKSFIESWKKTEKLQKLISKLPNELKIIISYFHNLNNHKTFDSIVTRSSKRVFEMSREKDFFQLKFREFYHHLSFYPIVSQLNFYLQKTRDLCLLCIMQVIEEICVGHKPDLIWLKTPTWIVNSKIRTEDAGKFPLVIDILKNKIKSEGGDFKKSFFIPIIFRLLIKKILSNFSWTTKDSHDSFYQIFKNFLESSVSNTKLKNNEHGSCIELKAGKLEIINAWGYKETFSLYDGTEEFLEEFYLCFNKESKQVSLESFEDPSKVVGLEFSYRIFREEMFREWGPSGPRFQKTFLMEIFEKHQNMKIYLLDAFPIFSNFLDFYKNEIRLQGEFGILISEIRARRNFFHFALHSLSEYLSEESSKSEEKKKLIANFNIVVKRVFDISPVEYLKKLNSPEIEFIGLQEQSPISEVFQSLKILSFFEENSDEWKQLSEVQELFIRRF